MGLGGAHARQVGGTAGTGDDHAQAARFGLFGVLEEQIRGAVGGHHRHFMGNAQLFQHVGGVAQGGPVGLGAHDHAYQCAHRRASRRAPAGASITTNHAKERGLDGREPATGRPRESRAV